MDYKLLGVSQNVSEINIGDYIQALAASQFIPTNTGFIQREYIKQYSETEAKMIMNGWFMHHPENWPPSNLIRPLFVAFHINILAKDQLLSEESINYLKKHKPIGCRDLYTLSLLKSKNIDSYFSGCLTLTLGLKYKSEKKEDKIYIVDPYIQVIKTPLFFIRICITLILHFSEIITILRKNANTPNNLKKLYRYSIFYHVYKKRFSKEILLNAEYIHHDYNHKKELKKELLDNYYIKEAEYLVKKYARAKFVITSRIHCALPCLGLNTPVIYIDHTEQREDSKCRLGGIKDLFNTITWNQGKLKDNLSIMGSINKNNFPNNKNNWRLLADNLIGICQKWNNEIHSTI